MEFGTFLDKLEEFREEFKDLNLSFCNIEVSEPGTDDKLEILGFYPEDPDMAASVEPLRVTKVNFEEVRFGIDEIDDLVALLEEIKKDGRTESERLKSVAVRIGGDDEYLKVSKVCNMENTIIRRKRVDEV